MSKYYKIVSNFKFGNSSLTGVNTIDTLTSVLDNLKISDEKVVDIKYKNFIEILKSGNLNRISFITGAGISTTAGIPDFRSSDSGLFKTLQEKYKLSSPEEFFMIDTFKSNPNLFYEFAKDFDLDKYNATPTHVSIYFNINQ